MNFFKIPPILPGSLFLAPNQMIITRPLGKPLFPELEGVEETIPPESLPFDISLLEQDIMNYLNPPPPPATQGGDNVKPETKKSGDTDLVDTPSHKDDVVLPPDTPTGDTVNQKDASNAEKSSGVNEGLDSPSEKDKGTTQVEDNQPGLKDPPKYSTNSTSMSDKADKHVQGDKPGLKEPPRGSKKQRPKSSSKSKMPDESTKKDPKDVNREGGKHFHH